MHSGMNNIRRQLTLFVEETEAKQIEAIRDKYNPLQKRLIKCHVTICRENEIQDLEKVIENLMHLEQPPFDIQFGRPTLFNNGKGIFAGKNAFCAKRTNVIESFPPEKSNTGFSN